MTTDNDYLRLSQATREVPTRPHASTLWRWHKEGIRGHKLRTVKIGGMILTRKEWLEEFIEQCNQDPADELIKDGC